MSKKNKGTKDHLSNCNTSHKDSKFEGISHQLFTDLNCLEQKTSVNFNYKYREELAQIKVGRSYIDKMLYTEALSIFDGLLLKCADIKSLYCDCLIRKMFCLYQLGKYEEVLRCGEEAALIFTDGPDRELLLIFKIQSMNKLERYEDAINCANSLLSMNINNKDALYLKGEALNQLQRSQEAKRYLERASKIAPTDNKIETALALSKFLYYQEIGEINKALEYFEVLLEFALNDDERVADKNFMRYHKAFMLFTIGKYEDAIKWCDEVISTDPNYIPAWEKKAEACLYLGKEEESEKIYAMIQTKREQKEKGPAEILYFPDKFKKK